MIPLPLSKLDRDAQAAVEGKMARAGANRFKEFHAKASVDNGDTGPQMVRPAVLPGDASRSSARDEGGTATSERMDATGRRDGHQIIRHVHFNAPRLRDRAGHRGAETPAQLATMREAAK